MKIEWDLREFERFVDGLSETAQLVDRFKRITKAIAQELLRQIKTFTPRDEGTLISGWDGNAFLVNTLPNGNFEVKIVNKVEYAQWVNDGHRVRNRKDGEYLSVKHRVKVPVAYQWQKDTSELYVYGHFFVERGIVQLKNTQKIEQIIRSIKAFKLKIEGPCGFESSQVTAGGINTNEICVKTMQSKLVNGLYIIGEALNVDGDCGGYNLQWAFTTAQIAKDSILNG